MVTSGRSLLLVAVLGSLLGGCNAHFSCAGWKELSELKVARTDDPRTKAVVLEWKTFGRRMGCWK